MASLFDTFLQSLQELNPEMNRQNFQKMGNNALEFMAPTTGTLPEAATRMTGLPGAAWSFNDAKQNVQEGNYLSAALDGLGIIPGFTAVKSGLLPLIMGAMDWKKMAKVGTEFGSGGRDKLQTLLDVVGTDASGRLNSPSNLSGVVNEYMAASPYQQRILEQAQAAKEAGRLPQDQFQAIRRGFESANRTSMAGDEIAAHVEASLPKRVKKIDTTSYVPPSDSFLDLSLINTPAGEIIGTPQKSMLLGIPNTFNIDEFTSRMTPDSVRAMHGAAQAGGEIGGPMWYNMAPVYQKLVDIFGRDEGAAKFLEWAKGNAALSPRSGVVDQTIRESQLQWFKNKFGRLPTQEEMKQYPDMYGHLAHDVHTNAMQDALENGLVKTGDRPKIGSYYQNYTGNWQPGTMDVHHFTAANLSNPENVVIKVKDAETGRWVPKRDVNGEIVTNQGWTPDTRYYTPLEIATMEMGRKHGLDPAAEQAAVWTGLAAAPEFMIGGKTHAPRTSEPYAVIFDKVIRDSAAARGVSPEQHFMDVFNRDDYFTRAAGVAKLRNLKSRGLFDLGQ